MNDYRIRYVETILLQDPGRSVLDIAFEAGFKSKSAFNSIFNRERGTTPTKFRQITKGEYYGKKHK